MIRYLYLFSKCELSLTCYFLGSSGNLYTKKALNRENRNLVPDTITYDLASIITRKKIGIAWHRGVKKYFLNNFKSDSFFSSDVLFPQKEF